jgi:hypothetical protein
VMRLNRSGGHTEYQLYLAFNALLNVVGKVFVC